jgi:hypothetical protein
MEYRIFFELQKRFFKQLINDSFFQNLSVNECTPQNYEAMLEVLKKNIEAGKHPQLEKVLEVIKEKNC